MDAFDDYLSDLLTETRAAKVRSPTLWFQETVNGEKATLSGSQAAFEISKTTQQIPKMGPQRHAFGRQKSDQQYGATTYTIR